MLSEFKNLKQQQGVTLLEMMITLAIAAILLTVVAPGAQTILKKNMIAAEINETSGALQLARFLAIDEQTTSVICPSANFTDCDNTNWNLGKIVFVDKNANNKRDSNEPLRLATNAIDATNSMTGPNAPIKFDETGAVNVASSVLLCPGSQDNKLARELNVSLQGRIKLSEDTNNDEIHEDIDGTSLSCS